MGANLSTIGTLSRIARGTFVVRGGGASRSIRVYPASVAARWRGRRVEIVGVLGVTFQTGYELTVSQIARAPAASR